MHKLQQCIDLGANVDEENKDKGTPLMRAVKSWKNKAAVEFLLARKANVHLRQQGGLGMTILMMAVAGGKDICELLLRGGANKHARLTQPYSIPPWEVATAEDWANAFQHDGKLAHFISSWGEVCVYVCPLSMCMYVIVVPS